MKCIVDTASGVVFNLPNFCINDPFYKKEFLKAEEVPEKILEVRKFKFLKNEKLIYLFFQIILIFSDYTYKCV